MDNKISSGLRTLFLVHFILGLIVGLCNLFIPELFYRISGMEISDAAPYRLLGAAVLGFAAGSWFGFKAVNLEQVRIVVLTELVWPPLGALVSLVLALSSQTFAAAYWINFVVLAGFAIAFYVYFNQQEAAVTAAKVPSLPKAPAPKTPTRKVARRRRARA